MNDVYKKITTLKTEFEFLKTRIAEEENTALFRIGNLRIPEDMKFALNDGLCFS